MTIKYGELTVIYSNKVQDIVETFFSWINQEELKKESPKYIFLFDDGFISDETTIQDFNYEFLNSYLGGMPRYIYNIRINIEGTK